MRAGGTIDLAPVAALLNELTALIGKVASPMGK